MNWEFTLKNSKEKTLKITFQKIIKWIEVENDSKTLITTYVDIEFNNVNPNGENVGAINCNHFLLFLVENC